MTAARRHFPPRTIVVALTAVAAALLAGCGTTAASGTDTGSADVVYATPAQPSPPAPPPAPKPLGKYETDWKAQPSATTCRQWRTVMTPHQTFVMAADMLVAVSPKGSALPTDGAIHDFVRAIATACQPQPQLDVAQIGAAIYTIMSSGG